jgi:DNA-binding Lrp family transcriptional regulator
LDEIDKGVLFDLVENCRVTYQELSRKYGISANAIRRRVLNLEESGVISGYALVLSPAMTDTHYVFGLIDSDGSRPEAEMVADIGRSPYIIAAASYSCGKYAFVGEYHSAEELLQIGMHVRNVRSSVEAELHAIVGDRGEKIELTPLHKRILRPLMVDPRMSIVDLAAKTGLTARRVRRLLSDFEGSDAVRFRTLHELGAATSIPFIVRLRWDERRASYDDVSRWIQSEFVLYHWETYISASEPTIFSLLCAESLTEMQQLVDRMRDNDFITSVKTMTGGHHEYFRGIRHTKLAELLEMDE